MAISAMSFIPVDVKSQVRGEESTEYSQDSTEQADVKELERRNEERMTEAKDERIRTQTEARESQRISDEADDAAKQSRQAVRAEKRAQKSRERADKQAQKAKNARIKSDRNE